MHQAARQHLPNGFREDPVHFANYPKVDTNPECPRV